MYSRSHKIHHLINLIVFYLFIFSAHSSASNDLYQWKCECIKIMNASMFTVAIKVQIFKLKQIHFFLSTIFFIYFSMSLLVEGWHLPLNDIFSYTWVLKSKRLSFLWCNSQIYFNFAWKVWQSRHRCSIATVASPKSQRCCGLTK